MTRSKDLFKGFSCLFVGWHSSEVGGEHIGELIHRQAWGFKAGGPVTAMFPDVNA
jgi:hypothetical protein